MQLRVFSNFAFVTVKVAGYEHGEENLGHNSFRYEQGRKKMCEVKPVNEGERKKLNGGGNFTDYRWSRKGIQRRTQTCL